MALRGGRGDYRGVRGEPYLLQDRFFLSTRGSLSFLCFFLFFAGKQTESKLQANSKQTASKMKANDKQNVSKKKATSKQTGSKTKATSKQKESKKKAPSNHAGCCLLYALLSFDDIEDPLVAALKLTRFKPREAVVVDSVVRGVNGRVPKVEHIVEIIIAGDDDIGAGQTIGVGARKIGFQILQAIGAVVAVPAAGITAEGNGDGTGGCGDNHVMLLSGRR